MCLEGISFISKKEGNVTFVLICLDKILMECLGGSYSLFAGRDATRALSKMQLNPSLFSNEYDELTDLTEKERATARSWHEDFRGNFFFSSHILIAIFSFQKNTISSVVFYELEKKAVYILLKIPQTMVVVTI